MKKFEWFTIYREDKPVNVGTTFDVDDGQVDFEEFAAVHFPSLKPIELTPDERSLLEAMIRNSYE